SHDLNDGYKAFFVFKAETVANDFLYGSSDVFGSASISRCVVCECQIVVDRLGTSDETCGMTGDDGIVRQLLDRVHGIISADIDKSFDIQFVEDIENLVIYFSVLMDFRQFVTA